MGEGKKGSGSGSKRGRHWVVVVVEEDAIDDPLLTAMDFGETLSSSLPTDTLTANPRLNPSFILLAFWVTYCPSLCPVSKDGIV